ncbi:DnaE-like DNA polymerase III [Nocardia phage NC1]|nr:DnaE-like DNA polymerase III [Nocardia phage NC1]QSL67718.1 DnaE-like DNA polymerase III [Nocardia phage P69]
MKFVSLHNHTSFSHGDGYRLPKAHIGRVADLGMSAVGFTEHRSTSSHAQLDLYAREAGIKPIYGCEFDVALPGETYRRHFHQTVLAENEEGYRNLNRLVTLAWQQTKYVPRLYTPQLLDPKLTSGLIVLSGCADSQLSCTILGGKGFGDRRADWQQEDAEAGRILVEQFQEVYGDRYYLECQQFPGLERSTMLNQIFMDISRVTGVKPVVTADVHYPFPDDNEMQKVLHAAHRGGTVETVDAGWEYNILLTYPTSDQQIIDNLLQQELSPEEAQAALDSTAEIAERCTAELPKSDPIRYLSERLPGENSPVSQPKSSEEADARASALLKDLIEKGIDYRLEHNPGFAARWEANEDGYLDRLRYEFGLIEPKGFCDYFLVTADLVQWAKDVARMGVGPGRGSAAGSLICYVIRITEIDPMQFPLMQFERFIDPSRPDAPDIDIDFAHPEKVFEYAASKYGTEHVAHIGNFQRYRGKGALKDIGKAFSETIPFDVIQRLGKLIVDRPEGDARENNSVEDTFDSFPEAADLLAQYPDLWKATRLEGDYRTLSVHAAGMVISNRPITDTCALYEKVHAETKEVVRVIPYDKRDAERMGMLKLDILGLTTMAIIEDVIEMVPQLDWEQVYALPYDDPKTLAQFAAADLAGIFQFEGRTTRSIVERVFEGTPENWKDLGNEVQFMTLADINALSRPGALISGMTDRYIGVEQGTKDPAKYHPVVDAILASSNGCLVYQEQVMAIGREVGGFPGAKVGALRRIIGKKKGGGAFEEFFEEFKSGAANLHGMSEAQARQLWDWMAVSSSYLFNIPHAVSYAVIAYWAMWIKTRYPTEFYAAALRYAKTDPKDNKALSLMQDAVAHGIEVLPPDPVHSEFTWRVHGPAKVMAGFSQIPGIGEKLGRALEEWRDNEWGSRETWAVDDPITWQDMQFRKGKTGRKTKPDEPDHGVPKFGATMVRKAAEFSAASDPFGIYKATVAVDKVIDAIQRGDLPLGAPTADASGLAYMSDQQVVFVGLIKEVRIIDVLDDMRKRAPSKTLEDLRAELPDNHLTTKAKLICVDHIGADVHVNISRYRYAGLAADISEIVVGTDVAYVTGVAREGFGPTVQASALAVIDPNGA